MIVGGWVGGTYGKGGGGADTGACDDQDIASYHHLVSQREEDGCRPEVTVEKGDGAAGHEDESAWVGGWLGGWVGGREEEGVDVPYTLPPTPSKVSWMAEATLSGVLATERKITPVWTCAWDEQ